MPTAIDLIEQYDNNELTINKTKMKSKIKEIKEVKEFTNDYGVTFYHTLDMENGDKITIGKKKRLEVGQELEYEIVGDGQEYNKAKTPFTQGTPAVSNDNLKGIKVGHSVTNAVSIICANGTPEGVDLKEAIKSYAKMIYDISNELNEEI